MKQKRKVSLLVAMLLIGLLVAVWSYEQYSSPEDALAPMLRIDGILYQLDEEVGPFIGRQPDGTLTVISENGIPYEDEQANFGRDGMPYWRHQKWILVMIDDTCLLFEEAKIRE